MVMTVTVLPPTAQLPPIKSLDDAPLGHLHDAIQYLQTIYNPEIRGSRRIIRRGSASNNSPHAGFAPRIHHTAASELESGPGEPSSDDPGNATEIRADAFEHAYAVRWLTALIAQKTTTLPDRDDDDDDDDGPAPNLEALLQSAAALLAVCAGAASAGTRTRTYVLCGARVRLTDLALRNDDFGSVGAQTWGSACVLAEMIAEAPVEEAAAAAEIRVLELGAGTGLVSLTIGRTLEKSGRHGHRRPDKRDSRIGRAEIVVSDVYAPALENLRLNIRRNFPPECDPDSSASAPARGISISAHFLDWEEAADPARPLGAPFDVPFDEVFGADIVYELEHAAWIKACLRRVLRLTGRFHLVIPLREGFTRESATVERVFPHVEDLYRAIDAGPTLCITQKEDITCEAWPEGKGEVEYVHYTIRW
ncbi:hypothetical protein F5148DRAFT_1337622, partial [Russula earlei]